MKEYFITIKYIINSVSAALNVVHQERILPISGIYGPPSPRTGLNRLSVDPRQTLDHI